VETAADGTLALEGASGGREEHFDSEEEEMALLVSRGEISVALEEQEQSCCYRRCEEKEEPGVGGRRFPRHFLPMVPGRQLPH
jgi:hypothetical protein